MILDARGAHQGNKLIGVTEMISETDFDRIVEVSKALGYTLCKGDVLAILESLTMKDFCNPDKVEAYKAVRDAMMKLVLTK